MPQKSGTIQKKIIPSEKQSITEADEGIEYRKKKRITEYSDVSIIEKEKPKGSQKDKRRTRKIMLMGSNEGT